MNTSADPSPAERSTRLAVEFLDRVWGPQHELDAIDELMTEDYEIVSAGLRVSGREAFKEWVRQFQRTLLEARTRNLGAFADETGAQVVSRWVCTGRNNGLFGLPPDQRAVSFTGIAIWTVRDGRLARCWAERSALELYIELQGANRK